MKFMNDFVSKESDNMRRFLANISVRFENKKNKSDKRKELILIRQSTQIQLNPNQSMIIFDVKSI